MVKAFWYISSLFHRKLRMTNTLAGLLTRSPLPVFPSGESDLQAGKGITELTASGNVQDFHLIPF